LRIDSGLDSGEVARESGFGVGDALAKHAPLSVGVVDSLGFHESRDGVLAVFAIE
jgi:hypothetical protein